MTMTRTHPLAFRDEIRSQEPSWKSKTSSPRRLSRESLASTAGSGFTLVELMVVITVIGILASMLLPALARAKARGQSALCLSHQRQMGLAWLLYNDDHNGSLMPNKAASQALAADPDQTWVRGFMLPNPTPDNTNSVFLRTSRPWPYASSLGLWKCTDDKSSSRHGGASYPRVRSLTMNALVGTWDQDYWSPRVSTYVRESDFHAPSQIFIFADTSAESIRSGIFGFDEKTVTGPPGSWATVPASRHGGNGTFSFADGHAEVHRWLEPGTATQDGYDPRPRPGNRDLAWLATRTTTLREAP